MKILGRLFNTKKEVVPDTSFEVGVAKVLHFQRNSGYLRLDIDSSETEPINQEIGEPVNLWVKPVSDIVYAFEKGTFLGDGLIGTITNVEIADHLRADGYYEAKVVEVNWFTVAIEVILKNTWVTEKHKNEWKEQLTKSYTPRSSWMVGFLIKEGVKIKHNFSLGFDDLETTLANLEELNSHLKLKNFANEEISIENISTPEETLKTLRAIYSGHELALKFRFRKGQAAFFEVSRK